MMKQVKELAIGDTFMSYSGLMTVTEIIPTNRGLFALSLKDHRGKRDTMVLGKATFVSVLRELQ